MTVSNPGISLMNPPGRDRRSPVVIIHQDIEKNSGTLINSFSPDIVINKNSPEKRFYSYQSCIHISVSWLQPGYAWDGSCLCMRCKIGDCNASHGVPWMVSCPIVMSSFLLRTTDLIDRRRSSKCEWELPSLWINITELFLVAKMSR
jgi:hypothetical protein